MNSPLPPVMSFPKIRVLSGDKVTDYDGVREVDPLLSFIRKTVTTPRKKLRAVAQQHVDIALNAIIAPHADAAPHADIVANALNLDLPIADTLPSVDLNLF